jgi:hypothetical protein
VGASKAKTPDVDDLDAGWEDEEDDLDSGWGDTEEADEPEPPDEVDDRPSTLLTPEEREARVARAAERKERQRAKALEKSARRRARAQTAKAKQKKSAPKLPGAPARKVADKPPRVRKENPSIAVADLPEETRIPVEVPIATVPRRDLKLMSILVAVVVTGGALAMYLLRR